MGEIVDPMEFAESHADEVDIIEPLSHVVHEVEEGEISPEAALEEIKELLESSGEDDDDEDHGDEGEKEGDEAEEEDEDHGDEDELPAMALAIVKDVEDGRMDASDAIEAIEALTAEGEDEHAGHGHGIEDPHFWFDPLRVKLVVNDIAARLSALDPDRGDTYRANASAYNVRLDELHAWTKQQVSAVPEDRRLLVTSHDSLGYFANLYGFEVVGVVLSITTEVEPSAGDLIELVEEVTENGIPAVFGETTVSERLAAAVATESGAKLVRLYSGSLGLEDSGAETYIDMIRTNVERIVEVLR
jgi:ABC-type Zn uptake system ZnuABC Zn-binding protein ZnuA